MRAKSKVPMFDFALPMMTNLGPGQTRQIGPTRVVFTATALFVAGEELRFTVHLRGTASMPLDLFCYGVVDAVTQEDTCFVVHSSIERTAIVPAARGLPPADAPPF